MIDIHPIQIKILQDLLFSRDKKYSELKPQEMEGSQFTFHLNRLIGDGYINKSEIGVYELSDKGKEFANRMNSDEGFMGIQPKSTTVMCATRGVGADTEFLLYKRLKNPFFGQIGFPTHKFWYGDGIVETAKKGLREEANLDGEPILIGIKKYRVFYEGILREDKIMYFFLFEDVKGELESKRDGEFFWSSINELEGPLLPEFVDQKKMIDSWLKTKKITFEEKDQNVNYF
jgi:ADP-ribose pyrophosphatase YjhB (NUDIX family)